MIDANKIVNANSEGSVYSVTTAEPLLTKQSVIADIVDVLGVDVDAISGNTDLIDHGLDSIRTMYLVDKWQATGVDIQFFDLVDDSTVDGWWRAIETKMNSASE